MNFHFARAAKRRGVPTLQYVAPQLWAWAQWRMKKLRRWVDRVACILPFEEAYFRGHGVNATFVGHPLFDELPPDRGRSTSGPRFPDAPPVVGLLPGSRRARPQANFPRMLAVAARLLEAFPDATFLVPTTAATHPVVERWPWRAKAVATVVAKTIESRAGRVRRTRPPVRPVPDRLGHGHPARRRVRRADDRRLPRQPASSGTSSAGGSIRTRTYALVNVLSAPSVAEADPARHTVPEFIPWYGPTNPAADAALDLLRHPEKLSAQRDKLAGLIHSLDRPGASLAAARMAMELLRSGAGE